MLNSNNSRTCEDVRLEVVTYVEAKLGSIIRASRVNQDLDETLIRWTLMRRILLQDAR